LNHQETDWNERDQNCLQKENPFSFGRGWTEPTQTIGDLMFGHGYGRSHGGVVVRMVNF